MAELQDKFTVNDPLWIKWRKLSNENLAEANAFEACYTGIKGACRLCDGVLEDFSDWAETEAAKDRLVAIGLSAKQIKAYTPTPAASPTTPATPLHPAPITLDPLWSEFRKVHPNTVATYEDCYQARSKEPGLAIRYCSDCDRTLDLFARFKQNRIIELLKKENDKADKARQDQFKKEREAETLKFSTGGIDTDPRFAGFANDHPELAEIYIQAQQCLYLDVKSPCSAEGVALMNIKGAVVRSFFRWTGLLASNKRRGDLCLVPFTLGLSLPYGPH